MEKHRYSSESARVFLKIDARTTVDASASLPSHTSTIVLLGSGVVLGDV